MVTSPFLSDIMIPKAIHENSDKAVSPIIATILIVAITVVLAATLYAVIGGYGGLLGKPTPQAGIEVTETAGAYTITIISVSGAVSFSDLALKIVYGSTSSVQTHSLNHTVPSGQPGYDTSISGPGPLSPADTIYITPVNNPGDVISITIVDTASSGTVASWTNPHPITVI